MLGRAHELTALEFGGQLCEEAGRDAGGAGRDLGTSG